MPLKIDSSFLFLCCDCVVCAFTSLCKQEQISEASNSGGVNKNTQEECYNDYIGRESKCGIKTHLTNQVFSPSNTFFTEYLGQSLVCMEVWSAYSHFIFWTQILNSISNDVMKEVIM